jgi:hypothetical protein
MVHAYQNMGEKAQADEISTLLENWNEPTLEHALVVPQFRTRHTERAAGSFMRM